MIGKRLGRYQIVSAIGKGGMGEVYSAIDTTLDREVAIKTLPTEFEQDARRLARFQREAKLLASLNHPNVATLYGLEQADASSFIVLELIGGETLGERLERGPVAVEEALRLAQQIAEAIEAAHGKGVIHRDLKPANIKITPDGQIKVLDFGLAKALAGENPNAGAGNSLTISAVTTGRGLVLGTPGYMSPEQARGEVAGQQADIWAFGVVLFEMLTGQPVFRGSTLTDIQASVLKVEPSWNELPARLHPRVRMLLERCLAKDARQRYAGIADARVDLQAVLEDPRGVLPGDDSESPARTLVPWAAAVVLAAIAGSAAWYSKPTAEPLVAQFEVETLGTLPEEGAAIALSPDQRHLVYPANNRLYLRNLDRPDAAAVPIPGTENGANPFFSPDSEWVAFFTDAVLRKVSLVTDETITLTDIADGWAGEWADNGRIYFSQLGESGIWWVPDAGGVARELVSLNGRTDFDHPEVLPGGDWLLLTERSDDLGLGIVAIATDGTENRRVITRDGEYMPRYVATGHLLFARDGSLWAVGFDASALEFTTDPFRVFDGVSASATGPRASFSLAGNGSIAYVAPPPAGNPPSLLVLIDLDDGSREYLGLGPAQYRNPRISPDGSRILFETIETDGRSAVWVFEPDARAEPDRLTIAGSNTRPLWQDDEWVLYASDREGPLAIYRQSTVTNDAMKLLDPVSPNGDCPASWDPDRRLLFLSRQGCGISETWMSTVESDGTVSSIEPLPRVGYGAELSPNGAYLSSFPGPTLVEVRRFPVTDDVWRIGNGGAYPTWSPDGASMVFRRASQVPGRPAAIGQMIRIPVATGASFGYLDEEILPIEGFTPNFAYRDYDFTADGRLLMAVHADPDYVPPEPGITVILNWAESLKERVPLP